MEELFNLDLSENTIRSMIELNPYLKEVSVEEVKEKEIILEKLGCSKIQIRNIISSNSLFLNRTNEEIIKLSNYLFSNGFDTLNILYEANPYILNLDVFEIEDYINNRINNGEEKDNIIDDLDSNPYLFNEI